MHGLRIAWSPRLGYAPRLHPEVEAAVAAAARTLESLGAIVEQADPDIGGDPITLWDAFWWPAMRYTFEALGERWRDQADPALVAAVDSRRPVSVSDHLRAQLQRADIHNTFVRFHQRYDLLITPAVPLPAFEAGALVPPSGDWGRAWTDWSPFSYPFNLTTQPAASVPCGLTAAGLPIGLQVVGPIGGDALVLRACPRPGGGRAVPDTGCAADGGGVGAMGGGAPMAWCQTLRPQGLPHLRDPLTPHTTFVTARKPWRWALAAAMASGGAMTTTSALAASADRASPKARKSSGRVARTSSRKRWRLASLSWTSQRCVEVRPLASGSW